MEASPNVFSIKTLSPLLVASTIQKLLKQLDHNCIPYNLIKVGSIVTPGPDKNIDTGTLLNELTNANIKAAKFLKTHWVKQFE